MHATGEIPDADADAEMLNKMDFDAQANKFLEKMVSIDTAHPGVFAKSRAGLRVLAHA